MKKLISILLAAAFLAVGSLTAVASDKGPASVTLEAKMGNVTFNHQGHQAKVADCTTCHHKGMETPKCTSCHGAKPEAPSVKDAFHKQCKGCHEKQSGPTGCKDCHKK